MTDRVKAAVADLTRTIREIRESTGPAVVRREEGNFFTFTTPATSSSPVKNIPAPEPPKER